MSKTTMQMALAQAARAAIAASTAMNNKSGRALRRLAGTAALAAETQTEPKVSVKWSGQKAPAASWEERRKAARQVTKNLSSEVREARLKEEARAVKPMFQVEGGRKALMEEAAEIRHRMAADKGFVWEGLTLLTALEGRLNK